MSDKFLEEDLSEQSPSTEQLPGNEEVAHGSHTPDYDFNESAIDAANRLGMVVVYPDNDELLIDIDSEEAFETYQKRKADLSKFFDFREAIVVSKSGLPHRHIYLKLLYKEPNVISNDVSFRILQRQYNKNRRIDLPGEMRILLQIILGSDPVRETLGVYRILCGVVDPTRFFEKNYECDRYDQANG